MDPVVTGVVVEAGKIGTKIADSAASETVSLLQRLLGPSADVIGEGWADRLRQRNLTKLLEKTEKRSSGGANPGWAQPRVADAVFGAAQFASDEIVTDYLSGVLASARSPEDPSDDALPWSNLVARLSALQLRIHYVAYLNFRQVLRATEEKSRLYKFTSRSISLPSKPFLAAVGLDPEGSDFQRFSDAVHGLRQEDLFADFAYGERDFFTSHEAERRKPYPSIYTHERRFETPYEDVIILHYSPFGVQFFLWGIGLGMALDTDYIDPVQNLHLEDTPESTLNVLLEGVGFTDSFWKEYDSEGKPIGEGEGEDEDEARNEG